MVQNDVEDDRDPRFVTRVDQGLELGGRAEGLVRGGEEARVVAPKTAELGHGHQLGNKLSQVVCGRFLESGGFRRI